MFTSVVVALAMTGSHVSAQDPAEGWMAYAVGSLPTKAERITRLEMTWTVGGNAKKGRSAFYSPWFGMDPSDNLNLLQPVNPWGGRGWQMYTEYFQWSPEHNSNSRSFSVKAGQTLHGAIIYSKADDSYTIQQTIVETGEKSSQVVKCQTGKKFTVPYVVYEKTWGCSAYPPEGKVTFHDIVVECDGTDCTKDVQWQAKFKDDNCNMRAHIDPSANEISITWDTSATSKYDNHTASQLTALNARGWAARFAEKVSVQEPDFVEEWSAFKKEHNRVYGSVEEENQRLQVFKENMLQAATLQRLNPLAKFGVSRYSDMSDEEFSHRAAGMKPGPNHSAVANVYTQDEVASILKGSPSADWRTKNAVTAVKDQGDCGGCWAFASTGNIEGQWAIAGNKLTSLSEQELLECDDYFPCSGCNGGEMSCAFLFLKSERKGSIATEASYPYTAGAASKTGKCKGAKSTGATITGSKDLPTNEKQMAAWLATNGPIAIGAYAIPWKQYKSGILTSCGSGDVDHAILIVGYGTENGQDYWTIKNSWGKSYGEAGYIRIARGVNLCKVASQPTTAVVKGSQFALVV